MKIVFTLFLALSGIATTHAQVCRKEKLSLDSVKVWMLTHPFEYKGDYKVIKGGPITLGKTNRPAFIFFGWSGCPPCHETLPYFSKLSTKYNNVDFVYITFDNEPFIQKEFDQLKIKNSNSNFYVLQSAEENMKTISPGFPTYYILHKSNMIRYTNINFIYPNSWPGEPITIDPEKKAVFWDELLNSL